MAKAEEVLVQTPYIICSRDMYRDLRSVCDSGTRTDILINAVEIGSNPFGCTDYLNQKKPLRDTGVSMYEYLGDQALHTKALVVGDDLTIAGSCNFDMRSVYLDTELMLAIRSPQLNAQIRGQIQELQEHSRRMAPDALSPTALPTSPGSRVWANRSPTAFCGRSSCLSGICCDSPAAPA